MTFVKAVYILRNRMGEGGVLKNLTFADGGRGTKWQTNDDVINERPPIYFNPSLICSQGFKIDFNYAT